MTYLSNIRMFDALYIGKIALIEFIILDPLAAFFAKIFLRGELNCHLRQHGVNPRAQSVELSAEDIANWWLAKSSRIVEELPRVGGVSSRVSRMAASVAFS